MDELIVKHGGYRSLVSFKLAQLVYDVTVRFCERYVSRFSRTTDQMVQAARSGVQNIAEGSQASGTSKKTEIKLTNVARASLEELRLDYEDFLRQRQYSIWPPMDVRVRELVTLRPQDATEVAQWVKHVHDRDGGTHAEIAANAVLVLIRVASSLLGRQITALAAAFANEGGFTERLYNVRKKNRKE